MMRIKILVVILAVTVLTAGAAFCLVNNIPASGAIKQLIPPVGNILIIDDEAVSRIVASKYDESGHFVAPGYERSQSKSADRFTVDLGSLGYATTIETMVTTDPATWGDYDILLISSGGNVDALDDEAFLAEVVAFVEAGGRLLLEGGEVGFSHKDNVEFANKVMHTDDWNHDESGTLDVADTNHFVMSVPNLIGVGNSVTYEGWGDHDAMIPLPDAQFVGTWSDFPSEASVICYDPNPAPEGGQIVFYTFNYANMESTSAVNLLQNSVSWLMTPESGQSTISGTVTLDGETDHTGILVELTPRYLSITTDATGYYEFTDIFADNYTVSASKADWNSQTVDVTVTDGEILTGVDVTLTPVLFGEFSGMVTDAVTSAPISGTVKVIDTVSGDLVVEVTTDPVTGAYAPGAMPYGNYDLIVDAYGYIHQMFNHDLTSVSVVLDFTLAGSQGEILLVDDHTTLSKSVDFMAEALEDLGFDVYTETLPETDPLSWHSYDLLIVSSGSNDHPLNGAGYLTALSNYTQAGGHLLLEGGDIGVAHISNTDFAANVLHATAYQGHPEGEVIAIDPAHPVVSVPNVISSIHLYYDSFTDSDGMTVASDAVMIGGWSSAPEASIIGYDPTLAPEGGQIVYFTFDYLALSANHRGGLLENAVVWLLATESTPTAAISGIIELTGVTDYTGTLVELSPSGASMVTGPDGTYGFTDLFSATYTLRVSHQDWGTEIAATNLGDGEVITDFDFTLEPVLILESCSTPVIAIPDNDPIGLSDIINASLPGNNAVSGVEVFLDVTHTFLSDLLVTLTSPSGTTVILHNETGAFTQDLYGWYPTELTPDGDFDTFIGEDVDGDWVLNITDDAPADSGTLNEWCVKLLYTELVAVGASAMTGSSDSDGVILTWDYQPSMIDGFHVYRRTAGKEALRLTSDLLTDTEGRIEYLDTPEAFAPGTKLYYSYALVVDGAETGRGNEIEVMFNNTPTRFTMHRSYPNPFNPMTTIKFELSKPGHAKLQIFDLSGRMVRTLVDMPLPAAVHQREWNGTNDQGRRMASGTYYFRLTSDGHTAVQKVMLVR